MRATVGPTTLDADGAPSRPDHGRRRLLVVAVVSLVALAALAVVLVVVTRGDDRDTTGRDGSTGPVATGVAVGATTSCALADGEVWCWGGSASGPTRLQPLSDVVELAGGGDRYCARDRAGATSCWTGASPGDVDAGPDGLERLAVGATHACGLRDQQVWCWGEGSEGQLGDEGGDGAPATEPVRVELDDAVDVAVAGTWSCAALGSGQVWCWGTGPVDDASPAAVAGVTGATEVAVAEDHACAVVAQGAVRCWGEGDSGVLGDGAAGAGERLGDRVVGLSGVGSLSTGRFSSCAVADTEVFCWGDNALGQLGVGERSGPRRQPVPVDLDAPVQEVAVGDLHACALVLDGRVWCWGGSSAGQTGSGTRRSDPVPQLVPLG